MKEHAKSLLIMVVPTMAFGWVVVSGTSLSLQHPPHEHLFLSYSDFACTLPWSRRSLGTLHCRLSHSNRSSYLCCHHTFVSLASAGSTWHLPILCLGGIFATKHVPVDIRRILSAESAANDGLAYPFLSIAIYLTVETSTRVAIEKWFLIGWLCKLVHVVHHFDFLIWLHGTDQVILGTVLGAVLGQLLFTTREHFGLIFLQGSYSLN